MKMLIDDPRVEQELIHNRTIEAGDLFEPVGRPQDGPYMYVHNALISMNDPWERFGSEEATAYRMQQWIKDKHIKKLPKGYKITIEQE